MKKLFISLMALVASFSVSAADIAVTAGVGAASIANDECDATFAYNLGVKLNFNINDNLFVEGSGLLQHQGFTYTPHGSIFGFSFSSDKTYDYDLYYLSVPVNIGWNFNVNDKFSIAPKLGLTFSAGLFGDESDMDCDPFSEREENSRIEAFGFTSGSFYENFNRINLGFNLGANFNIAKKFQIGAQYTLGMSDIADDIKDSKDRIFTANFAYFF
ncbi:MAG: porin family protein [Paludibacteraceae bacterium]|nr:porin family protein [Paludibacteraceae bacterium]